MARQHENFQIPKSIVGAALAGLGFLILFRNLEGAVELGRFIRITGEKADSLGILAAASVVIQKGLQAYLFNHAEFLQTVCQVLVSFSALLLIVTGAIFFAAVFEVGEGLKKKE